MCINSPGREVLRISSDADDRMETKFKTKKNIYGLQKFLKKSWTKT